jgi:uncharacterized protein
MGAPTINFTEDKGQIYLHCLPVAGQNPLDLHSLQTLVADKGFSECVIDAIALETALNDCNTRTEPFQLPIGRRIDSAVTVHIAADEMSAEISISAAHGGKTLVASDVVRALHEAGVVHGVKPASVVAALGHKSCDHVMVATGTPVIHGENSKFELLISLGGSQTPVPDEEGHIDYREHIGISLVDPGTPLVRRIPATPGTDGTTVRGNTISAKEGKDEPFPADLQGTQLSESDPNLLIATISGHPVAQAACVYVDPLIRVPEVNLSTGHINFNGAVQVDGDVTQGMKIKAKGNVVISGVVEASSIQTEGDILIKGGIIAHAQLVAGGMVVARFAEGAAIVAGKGIVIEEMALECNLQAQEDILIGLKVPQRGRLVGGITKSMTLIKAPYIGSDKGGLTRVIVGVHELLENQHRTLQFELAEKQHNEDNLRKIVQQLTITGDPKKMLDRVKASLREALKITMAVQQHSDIIDEQLNHLRKSKVEVTQGTAGTVEVTVANHKVRLAREYGRGHFGLSEENRITHSDPKGFASIAT